MNLGPPVNTATNDFGPNLSIDGHLLFFASARPGGFGGADIYVSHRDDPNDDFAWGTPVNVGPPINTANAEQAPFYLQNAEDGSGNLYFNRGLQVIQAADIYYASVTRDGEAQGDVVFVAELSSPVNDFAVTIRKDGRETFFTSPRPGTIGGNDIWTSTRRSIHDPWETPQTPELRSILFSMTAPRTSHSTDVRYFSRQIGRPAWAEMTCGCPLGHRVAIRRCAYIPPLRM